MGQTPQAKALSESTPDVRGVLSARLQDKIKSLFERYSIPAAAIAVVNLPASPPDDGRRNVQPPVEQRADEQILCWGKLGPGDTPAVDAHTLFGLGSTTKLFTAVAIGLLIHHRTPLPSSTGTLEWTTRVQDILPEWSLEDEAVSKDITIADLLSMQTGAAAHDLAIRPLVPSTTLISHIKHLRNRNKNSAPRSRMAYNNINYIVAGEIVRRSTGMTLAEYVEVNVLGPLGMEETFWSAKEAGETGRRVKAYVRVVDGKGVNPGRQNPGASRDRADDSHQGLGRLEAFEWWTTTDPNAGFAEMLSSASDMVKWLTELLRPSILPSSLLPTLQAPRIPYSPLYPFGLGPASYGLGQMILPYRGHTLAGHLGTVPGAAASLFTVPDKGLGVFISTNDREVGMSLRLVITFMVLDELLGLEARDWEAEIMGKLGEVPPAIHPPAEPRFSPPSSHIVGRYSDKAHGEITARHPNPDLSSPDPSLLRALSTYPPLRLLPPLKPEDILIINLSSVWSTHLVLIPSDGPIRLWINAAVFPRLPSTDDATPDGSEEGFVILLQAHGKAVCTPEGLGMFGGYGNFWQDVPEGGLQAVDEVDPQDSAEVWFARV